MSHLFQKLMLGGSAVALAAAMPCGAAQAQNNNDIEQVVVSASRVTIAGYSQPTPVTVVGAAQLEQDAFANIQDSVRQLPQVLSPPSTYGANNGGLGGLQGANFVNLRALGVQRTLVLFDSQRVVASNINSAVDVTTLPSAVVQRVDVVTGGASAAWGSDAVAGVVNFVINKNLTGFKSTIEGSDTSNGLVRSLSASAAWGDDIFGGRGHVEFAVTTTIRPDTVLLTDEHWYKSSYWVSNPAYVAGNGQPQMIVATNVGLSTSTVGGLIVSSPVGIAGPGVVAAPANALRGIEFVGGGATPQLVNFGNVTLGSLSNGGTLGMKNSQEYWQPIATPQNVYTLFGYARYKLTDTIQASVQLNYGYFTGKNDSGDLQQTGLVIKTDNAYIPAAVRAAMQNGGITTFTMGTANSNNFDNNIATGKNFWAQAANAIAPVTAYNRRNFVRGVFTLEGTLGDDWSWNAYIQESAVRYSAKTLGNSITANLLAAQDAVTVTSANVGKTGFVLGGIACRQSLTGTRVVNAGVTADPDCVPMSVFGNGVISSAAIAYVSGHAHGTEDFNKQSLHQDVMEASMQGTLPWELPAGKVAIAFGAGYRKEAGFTQSPAISLLGGFSQADFPAYPHVAYNVIEGFGEMDAPILKNNIVNSLDFSMAGRMTSYSTSGLVETWKLGATSQVTDDIKLRTNWSVDIRAPQLSDLYNPGSIAPQTQRDPKTQNNVPVQTQTTGNVNLLPEVARTISGGAVLTPTFIPGLSLSADWYSINITGEIAAPNVITVLNQCNAQIASAINPGQQGNPNDPLCVALIFNGPNGALSNIHLQNINFASQTVSGLDLQANYVMDFWDGTLSWATTDSYNDENTTTQPGQGVNDVAGSNAINIGTGALPGPKWKGLLSANYATGPWSITAQGRWYGTSVTYQNGNSGNQSTAANANLYDPAHFHMPFTAYLDLRFNYKWNDNISFFGAMDNVINTPPPLLPALSNNITIGNPQMTNTNTTVYDVLGRDFRLGIRLNY